MMQQEIGSGIGGEEIGEKLAAVLRKELILYFLQSAEPFQLSFSISSCKDKQLYEKNLAHHPALCKHLICANKKLVSVEI